MLAGFLVPGDGSIEQWSLLIYIVQPPCGPISLHPSFSCIEKHNRSANPLSTPTRTISRPGLPTCLFVLAAGQYNRSVTTDVLVLGMEQASTYAGGGPTLPPADQPGAVFPFSLPPLASLLPALSLSVFVSLYPWQRPLRIPTASAIMADAHCNLTGPSPLAISLRMFEYNWAYWGG